jgi:hypothetical protein
MLRAVLMFRNRASLIYKNPWLKWALKYQQGMLKTSNIKLKDIRVEIIFFISSCGVKFALKRMNDTYLHAQEVYCCAGSIRNEIGCTPERDISVQLKGL